MPTRSGCRIAPAAIVLVLALAPPAASVEAPPESTASKLLDALGVVRPSGPRSADSVTAPNDTRGDLPSTMVAGIVLREVRTSSSEPGADTLVTFLSPGRMRVTYGDMHTILDVTGDRFLLLETETATYRSIPFSDWESEVRRSPDDASEPDTLPFEAMAGEAVPIAGYPCSRYHLFSRREVLPGEFETVEQEIWVTRELALPLGALETWRRVQQALGPTPGHAHVITASLNEHRAQSARSLRR